jgi:hypothetical protein
MRKRNRKPSKRGRTYLSEALEPRQYLSGFPLQAEPIFPTGVHPFVVTDINGDGAPDIVGVDVNKIVAFFGNGNGTFQPILRTLFYANDAPTAIAAADLTGDGIPDLIVAGANLTIFEGNGTGTYGSFHISQNIDFDYNATSITVADFNHDGKPDIAIAGNNKVYVLLGNGNGTFRTPGNVAYSGCSSVSIAVGDLNADPYPDIAVVSGYLVSEILGNGDGTFQLPIPLPMFSPYKPISIALGDLSGDGNLDIVTGDAYTRYRSPGNFASYLTVAPGFGNGNFGTLTSIQTAGRATAVAVGDVNGDGIPGIIALDTQSGAGFPDHALDVFDGANNFSTYHSYNIGTDPSSIALVDVNGDGRPDIVAGSASGISVLLSNGGASFSYSTITPIPQGPTLVGDLNGDRIPDLISGNQVYLGTGNATFEHKSSLPQVGYALADLTGNGKLDLITNNSVLLGNGDGTFGPPKVFTTAKSPEFTAVADFNGDGIPDLVITYPLTDTVGILLGNGNGTFKLKTTLPYFNVVSVNPLARRTSLTNILVGDVNGDGIPDIIDGFEEYLGNGDGTFKPGIVIGAYGYALADVNDDGKLDLISGNAV